MDILDEIIRYMKAHNIKSIERNVENEVYKIKLLGIRDIMKSEGINNAVYTIRAPLAGIVKLESYRNKTVDGKLFLETFDYIQKGEKLCEITGIKETIDIFAEIDGQVLKIYFKNGQPIEVGQPLFKIRTKVNI